MTAPPSSPSPSTPPSFPVGSSVLLRDLVGAPHLNGTKGIVRSRPPPPQRDDGGGGGSDDASRRYRQEVYVFEARRAMSIRPANLRYEERIAELVARSNEPRPGGTTTTSPSSSSSSSSSRRGAAAGTSAEQLRQGAERMASMTPDDIRRQASAMRSMGAATLRAMNPQMANMSDEQIEMAIAQMEAVASDPSQLRMAADQMRNMSEGDLERVLDQTATAMGGGGKAATVTAVPPPPAAAPAPPVSKAQLEHAARQMSSMSPAQLRRQAAMLRSMPIGALRDANPHMSGMTDAQIEASIAQFETMADNPDMMRMAVEALSDPDKLDSATNSMDSMGAAVAGGMLSDPDQLNSAVKAMKRNPQMLKQMLTSQRGVSESQKEQMSRVIDSFATMDDARLEGYLKLANVVQEVAVRPIVRTKEALGLSTKTTLFILWIIMTLLACLVAMLAWRWWYGTRNDGVGTSMLAEKDGGPTQFESYYDGDSEF